MLNPVTVQIRAIRNHPVIFSAILIVLALTAYLAYVHGTIQQYLVYIPTMWLCMLVTDAFALRWPAPKDFPVRKPAKETYIVLLCTGIGLLALMLRFNLLNWGQMQGWVRLVVAIPLIAFAFPIVLLIIMLLRKYSPASLGFRLHGLLLFLPVAVIVALAARLGAPGAFTFDKIMAESGGSIWQALFMGIVTAGLSEEFMKMMVFTRVGASTQNKAFGWFIATVIWAFMHAPKWYADSHNLTESLLGSVRIIPIGLMWSYISYRTKSILPATLVHGTNVWGLQNF